HCRALGHIAMRDGLAACAKPEQQLRREPGLAHARWSLDRDQTAARELGIERVQVRAATDHAIERVRRLRRAAWHRSSMVHSCVMRSWGSIVLVLWAQVAAAQPTPEAARLFQEGRALLEAGKPAEACERFEQSLKLDPDSPGTILNLGL